MVRKGKAYYWARDPDSVMGDILSKGDRIKFGEAVELLRTAKTSKMPGHAN